MSEQIDKRLTEIDAREAAATPGPWEHSVRRAYKVCCTTYREERNSTVSYGGETGGHNWPSTITHKTYREDAAFIAHAREDIPWLLNEMKRLREGLESMVKVPSQHPSDFATLAKRLLKGDKHE